mmetsp:Transcript_16884/g.28042  ORF Transcript_16884/g.28042 Transcript_16884/m.28042 type:complete len:278 (+) Transcript_16884:131-964(+)
MVLNLSNEDVVVQHDLHAKSSFRCTCTFWIIKLLTLALATLYVLNLAMVPKTSSVDFDLYIMSMSYQPEFCHKHEDYPGCRKPEPFWKSHLTIHGMWPEYKDGTWPSFCTTEVLDNATIAPLLSRMEHYWPNVQALTPTAHHFFDFWKHEWSKHGTCSGLTQLQYFEAALAHFVNTPSILADNYGGTVNKTDLLEAYSNNGDEADAGNVILACQAKHWLSNVRICVGVMPNGKATKREPCPSMVISNNSCVGEVIRIAKFVPSFENTGGGRVRSSEN